MKRVSILLTGIALLAFLAAPASADILYSDDFNSYTNGDLVPQGGWATHSGAGSNPVQVLNGQVCLTHGAGSREDVNHAFAEQSSGIVSYSFDFSVADLGTPFTGTDFEYFAHFGPLLPSTSAGFVGRLDLVTPTGSGDFTLGIASFSSTADAIWGTDFNYGDTISVLVSYDIGLDTAYLSVNGGAAIAGATGTQATNVNAFSFRQSTSSNNESIKIDNLVISTNIPEPGSLGLLAVVAGIGFIRRRK